MLKNLPYNNNTQIKQLNWDIIHIINSLIKSKNISCTFHKIKSHSKNTFHNIANKLIKKGTYKLPFTINLQYFTPLFFFTWYNYLILFKLHQFNKSITFIQTLNNITQLKTYRNLLLINLKLNFFIFNSLSLNTTLYSFCFKILLNNLPTMDNLNIRLPHLFLIPNCTYCN